jgi:hypothetical protein
MGYLLVPRRTGPLDAPDFVLGAAEPVAAAQVSLLAVWLALGARSVGAPWRLVGTWLVVAFWARLLRVLAAPNDWHFISTGLALTFVLQAAAIVAALGAARYAGFCLADDPADARSDQAGPESFRFSLAALMLGTAALALCLATSRLVIHYPLLGDAPLAFLRRLGPRALGHAAVGLVLVWAVLGSRRLAARLFVTGLAIAAAVPLQAIGPDASWLPPATWPAWRPLLAATLTEAALVAAGLSAVRLAGIRLVRAELITPFPG